MHTITARIRNPVLTESRGPHDLRPITARLCPALAFLGTAPGTPNCGTAFFLRIEKPYILGNYFVGLAYVIVPHSTTSVASQGPRRVYFLSTVKCTEVFSAGEVPVPSMMTAC